MRWFWCIAAISLTACDVAPKPIDFGNSKIETAGEAYQVFADGALASSVSKNLAAACDGFDHDVAAERRYRSFFEAEFERLLVEDPEVAREFLSRLGFNFPKGPLPIKSFNDIKGRDINTAYLAVNAGVTFDIGARAIGGVLRQRGSPNCAAADREVAQGTLAGSFLRPSI